MAGEHLARKPAKKSVLNNTIILTRTFILAIIRRGKLDPVARTFVHILTAAVQSVTHAG